ncbi:MAG: serine/threonine protein kinase, partial [Gemmatimonadaceae bacterium]|nr:serine/threonine protein kinase [Gemmatimonadaceae bacterium]
VVHRDIKPDNVMLERATGRALVLDFGISRSMTHVVSASNLTRVGEVVGTPEYMSPEQASGDVVDGRSDLYALGLTAYYAATGETAMTGESTQKILVRQLTERIAPLMQLRPDLPPALAGAIDRCVEKDPAARFPTAEALVEEIDAAQLAEPEIPLPIRLFAGELSALSLAVIGILVITWLMVRMQQDASMSLVDVLLPVVGLLAVLFARTLTTMSEGRRLGEMGFSASDVGDGLARVMAERARRREELQADPKTRRRRRRTIIQGAVMLVTSMVMMRAAWSMRVPIRPGQFATPPAGLLLVFSGLAMLGISLVLLLRSPFRMSPGERLFRLIWLGPVGRLFVWLAMRGVSSRPTSMHLARAAAPPAPRVATVPQSSSASPMLADPLRTLEARVRELERWRREHEA